jgi:hypothetical protein
MIETITELGEFLTVLEKLEIPHTTHPLGENCSTEHDAYDKKKIVTGLCWVVSISQANLYFDKDKKFSCVKDDEMGNLTIRKE